jgi:hypothetical protein
MVARSKKRASDSASAILATVTFLAFVGFFIALRAAASLSPRQILRCPRRARLTGFVFPFQTTPPNTARLALPPCLLPR